MPGIAGLISRLPSDVCSRLAETMTACMQHEKFHDSGTYSAPELGVFAGWVALEDSSADCQPIVNEQGDVVLLLAGECFADPNTRARLKARDHHFEGNSAAWMVHLYEERGDSFFEELNGLFSGLLIDKRQQKAFLFNDRYGMERLYYHEGRDGFFFASEAKALLRVLPELRAFDEDGLAQFLHHGCTLDGKTLFRDITLLPAASLWAFNGYSSEKRRYFLPSSWESQSQLAAKSFSAELEKTFTRVLPRYFESDGEIGISLTGGLDTRMIMACRPQMSDRLVSYTFAGPTGETLDAQLASRVAAACGIPHHVLRIGHDFFSDFASLVDRTVYITDGCFGVCGAHEIYLNNQARGLAPVRLTGNFGSEILRGVTTFKPLDLADNLFDHDFRRSLPNVHALSANAATYPVSFAAFKEVPLHLIGTVRAAQSQINCRTPYMDNEIVALAYRAPQGVRRSSSPELRVIHQSHSDLGRIRTDEGLVPASRLSSLVSSVWYRGSFKLDYWYGEGMPHWLSSIDSQLSRLGLQLWSPGLHKYLHYSRWFKKELVGYIHERLTDTTRRHGAWNRAFLDQIVKDHTAGIKNYVQEINGVLTIEAIDRLLLRQPSEKNT
jgi:asparagine synthase (glutamine-hydrolysing)